MNKLTCYYYNKHPFIAIKPVKIEMASLKPNIYLLHDIIRDADIEFIKDLAAPRVSKLKNESVFIFCDYFWKINGFAIFLSLTVLTPTTATTTMFYLDTKIQLTILMSFFILYDMSFDELFLFNSASKSHCYQQEHGKSGVCGLPNKQKVYRLFKLRAAPNKF